MKQGRFDRDTVFGKAVDLLLNKKKLSGQQKGMTPLWQNYETATLRGQKADVKPKPEISLSTSNRGKPWTHDDLDELARLIVEDGLSDKEAGERLGRSLHSIETQRNFLGIRCNSKPGHSRPRIRAYHRLKTTSLGPSIHADPAMELARIKKANIQHLLDVAQMFGTTLEIVISEYKRRCEFDVTPDQAAPIHVPVSRFEGSACSSSAEWAV